MLYGYPKKVWGLFLCMVVASFLVQGTLLAQNPVLNRTGILKITKPDGTVLIVEKHELLPEIPPGSIIEIITGSIDISPQEGFIQIVVGNSVATVEAGDRVKAGIDTDTMMANFEVNAGQISVITGNTTATVKAGQKVLISLDKRTGVVEVRSVVGTIETVTAGIKASIPQDAVARISANAETRKVNVESVKGDVVVTSAEGEVIVLAKAESISAEGSVEGEIQTFVEEAIIPFVAAEEPVEPEVPEASPHRP